MLGASGCGKTTLLRLAARSLAPSAGRINNRFARVAVVFQEPRLMPWADALDNAAFGLKALGWAAAPRRAKARELLLRLGLRDSDLSKRPPALSGGMRQRVALARAMAIEPDLILMDKPFSALDLGLRRQLQDLLRAEVERAGTPRYSSPTTSRKPRVASPSSSCRLARPDASPICPTRRRATPPRSCDPRPRCCNGRRSPAPCFRMRIGRRADNGGKAAVRRRAPQRVGAGCSPR